jgi:translation initiation factor 1A
MPKNTGKGGKNFKRGKNDGEQSRRDVTLKKEGEEAYGCITKVLGNYRFGLTLDNDSTVTGVLRGCMRNKQYVVLGDIVLVQLRGEEDGYVDMIHKYKPDEVRDLLRGGHISLELQNAAQERQATHVGASAITFTAAPIGAAAKEKRADDGADASGFYQPLMTNPNRRVGTTTVGAADDESESESEEQAVPAPRKAVGFARQNEVELAGASPSKDDEAEDAESEQEEDLVLAAAAESRAGYSTAVEKQRNKRGTGQKKSKVDVSAYADI